MKPRGPAGGQSAGAAGSSAGTPREPNALMERVADGANLATALRRVERNQGAPGVDGMRVQELREHLKANWDAIRGALVDGSYEPKPVRRVEIPKPGGGKRLLGIPTAVDRLIQQALLQVLQPLFDPGFSEHSYGFRPGRGAHGAVMAAKEYIAAGYDWVVDLDLAQFFGAPGQAWRLQRV